MKKTEDIDQAELARLRDYLLENPEEDRSTDVEIYKVFHNNTDRIQGWRLSL